MKPAVYFAAIAALSLVFAPASADAHSRKEATEPADGAVLDTSPPTISMRFDMPMRVTLISHTDAVMSDADLLAYESLSAAHVQAKPYLMIHSDQSFLPDAARRHFEAMPSTAKTLLWEGDTPHLSFYDQPEILDRTVASITKWVAAL